MTADPQRRPTTFDVYSVVALVENAQLVSRTLRLCRTRLSGGPDVSRLVAEHTGRCLHEMDDDALLRRGRA